MILAIDDVLLSVQEPVWNFVLSRVRDDGDDFVNLNETDAYNNNIRLDFVGNMFIKSLFFSLRLPLRRCIHQRVWSNQYRPFSIQCWRNDDQHL